MPEHDTTQDDIGTGEGIILPVPERPPSLPSGRQSRARADQQVREVKALGQELLDYLKFELGESRDLSIARTHIETGVLWAVRHCQR